MLTSLSVQPILALVVFLGVYAAFATKLIPRAVAALVGAMVLVLALGPGSVLSSMVPEVLLTTAGLMVLGGFVKRSGLAAWLALKAAKVAKGRPSRIMLLLGTLSFIMAGIFGPEITVVLVVPVSLVLAAELDAPALPFVVILSWTVLLGGATSLTAQPGNVWVASALGIDFSTWILRIFPMTGTALVVTLVAGTLLFRRALRVTNERRARILEYDESRSLEDKPMVGKLLIILGLVVLGMVLGPVISLRPAWVVATGAILLVLWDNPLKFDDALGYINPSILIFFGALFGVVEALNASGISTFLAQAVPTQPWILLGGSAFLGAFVDHDAIVGALVPTIKAWSGQGLVCWPPIVVGSSLGAGVFAWGATSSAKALGMIRSDAQRLSWKAFVGYGSLLLAVNLIAVTVVILLSSR